MTEIDTPAVAAPPDLFNFAQHLLGVNAARANKAAFIDDAGTLSYGELADRVKRLAAGLRALGLKREERVLLLMQDGNDWPVSFLGAIHAGLVPVAVNTLLTADDYAYMLEHSRAQAALVSGALLPALTAAMTKSDHEVQKVIVSRPVAPLHPAEVEFEAFVQAHAPAPRAAATSADDPAFWLYSSGSTGRPKGTVHSHANPYWTSELYGRRVLGLRESDICFSAAKLFFAYGLGNALSMLKLRYDREPGRQMAAEIGRRMRDAAYRASVELAKEKGPFPKFQADGYLAQGTFASRLPEDIQAAIRQHGIRNSHLLSIAPTGTVSLAFADNASNGIEPAFSWGYKRNKREHDGSTSSYMVEDHAFRLYRSLIDPGATPEQPETLPEYFVNALEMTAHEHVAMMQAVQPYVDTSISKTVNIPEDYPFEDFKDLYRQAWQAGLKGLATYRPNSILGAVLEATPAKKEESAAQASAPAPAAVYDPLRTVIEKRPAGGLPAVAEKIEYWTTEGQQRLYLIVTFLPVPSADGKGTIERAIEFFMPVGQSGESQQWITATMRMLSLAARGGFLDRALSDMRKVTWDRGPVRLGTYEKADGTHVPRWHDSEVAAIGYAIESLIARRAQAAQASLFEPDELLPAAPEAATSAAVPGVMAGKKCPECGAHAMIRKDGCDYCTQCGYVGSCG